MPELLERPVAGAASPVAPAAGSESAPVATRRGRELVWVRAALAVVALHVIDDAFLNPEPGTSAGDHLVSGLVPTALLALLAWGYPRCRPWWQSVLSISVVVLALVNAIGVSGRHVVIDKFGGDDLTGLAAGLAGVVLIGAGLIAARWALRPRAADRSLPRRYGRRAGLAVAVIAGAFFVLLPLGIAIIATHRARAPVNGADLGRPYRLASFRSSDGLRLRGWYLPSQNGAAVIVAPGRTGTLQHARMLARHGYGVLVFDRRGEGESQGDFNVYGWSGQTDLRAAAAYVARQPDVRDGRVGGLGLSVGGETLLQAAADSRLFKAVVAEGASYRSLRDHLAMNGNTPINWISPLTVQTGATAVLSDTKPPPPLKVLVPRISPRAVFFVWGGRGQPDEAWNVDFYRAAGWPKQIWRVPGAGHVGGLDARPAAYERRIVGFFDRHLRPLKR
jgi:uncharacterized protein